MNTNDSKLDTPREPVSFWVLQKLGPLLALLVVVIVFAVADARQEDGGQFLSVRNFRVIMAQTAMVAVAALGMTLIIIAGGIDLSAGTGLVLAGTVLAWCLKSEYPIWIAVPVCIVIGCLCGLANGLLISVLKIVPFIVTLGTMTIFVGFAKYVSNETTVRPPLDSIPVWLEGLVSPGRDHLVYGLPLGVWFALVLSLLVAIVLRYTVFGRYVFALGSNEATARLCGINVPLVKTSIYTLAGFFVGVAGIYYFAKLKSANPTDGLGLELQVIAAVVIGGGSLNGGQGSVLGTLTGALIMGVISSGCTLLGVRNLTTDIIIGVIIIAAVTLDQLRQRRMDAA